jgi:hypothetical protein
MVEPGELRGTVGALFVARICLETIQALSFSFLDWSWSFAGIWCWLDLDMFGIDSLTFV